MSYYVKVGDQNDKIPNCCTECKLCRDADVLVDDCTLPEQTTTDPFYDCHTRKHAHVIYCTANDNKVIEDISKRPEWCPIPLYPEEEKHCHNCRFFHYGSMSNCRPDYPNLCTNTDNIFYSAKKLKKEEEYKPHPECFVPSHREIQKWINDEWPL